jgi:two-component system cell cycle sensor histidine kinase/response regulator CckA
MELEKKKYLKSQTERIIQTWVGISAILGIILFMSLSVLDYFVTPDNFKRFLIYRIAVSLFLGILYFLNKLKRKLSYQYTVVILGILSSAIALELMILHFGGHKSIYYAGINLLILCLLGVLPLNLLISVSVALLLYFVYLFPILLFDRITDPGSFINNNVFILATIFVAFIWRILSQKSLTKELELQYELDKDKEQLQTYSSQLEELVSARTKELSVSEERFRALFDNANDGIIVVDKNGTIVNVNHRFCEMHGFDRVALIGKNFGLLEAKKWEDELEERMDRIFRGESLVFEAEHVRKDGSRILVEVSSKAIDVGGTVYVQSFHRDVTEKKRLQQQLFQSQKMESIGVLAGGIAHDFNNILTAILGHAEFLQEFGNLDAAATQKIKTIELSARRAGQMVSKLLSFARKGGFEAVPVNLNAIVKDTSELMERVMGKKGIRLKIETDSTIPPFDGDPNQIEQVIMNLLVNAGDAMPDGGDLSITTSERELGTGAFLVHPLLSPGRYVVLRISDTGTGIAKQVRDKIFDPFFTTKETGKGTGLGLATVYGIVKDHKGVINLLTEEGKGTTFEIFFPASKERLPVRSEVPVYAGKEREKIFVVDDEESILSFIREALESKGYRVLVADNPTYALEISKNIIDDIDLIIADIVMPLVTGTELIKHFKELKPSVKIIAISGYETLPPGGRDNVDAFISKPFERAHLVSVVRRVLDSEDLRAVQ